jgi:hypothetical protein
MTDSVVAPGYATQVRRHATAWRAFVVLIALATISPILVVPFTQHAMSDTDAALGIVVTLNFLGANFHVASTGWFYTDPEMRRHFRDHPLRYLVVPALLIAGSAVAFLLADKPVRGWMLAAFFAWQLWHYQKQNVGVLSFMAAGTGSGPLSIWERRTLAAAAVAGILGFFSLFKIGLADFAPQFAQLHQLGLAVYLLVPVLLAIAVLKTPALRSSNLRLGYLVLGSLFFLPTYLFDDQMSATLGYAVAHGLQYLVFMGVVSVNRAKPIASLLLLVGIATLGALVLNDAIQAPDWSTSPYAFAIYGAFIGTVMAHFVIDAGIWRLREPFQRGYMRKRFFFVFDR